jgi:DNA invertase Pin-like site-specific DNA recombinase
LNIVAYCRVSTDKKDQLNSLKTQKNFFETYAKLNNHNLIKIYADKGITGTRMKNRKNLLDLLEDAKHNSFEMVVIKDVSRLARNTVDFLNIIRKLKNLGVKVLFVNYNMDTEEASELTLTILAAMAQEESYNTSKRVKFGKDINAKKGRVPNIVYGYDKIQNDIFNLNINQIESEIVKRIFNLYVKKGYGANKIALLLNNEGIKTKKGCKWNQITVSRILSNDIYRGVIINGKQEVKNFLTGEREIKPKEKWYIVEKPELRIVDDDIFNAANEIISRRNNAFKIAGKRTSNKHIFSTLIKCKHCGHSFRRFKKTYKNTYIRWVCSGRNSNGIDFCSNKTSIDEKDLIEQLNKYFINILESKTTYIDYLKKEFLVIYEAKNKSVINEKDLIKNIDEFKKEKKKEMDMYRADLVTIEELEKNIEPINSNIKILENKLLVLRQSDNISSKIDSLLENLFKDIQRLVDVKSINNEMLKKVIDKIVIDKNKNVEIYLKRLGKLNTIDKPFS